MPFKPYIVILYTMTTQKEEQLHIRIDKELKGRIYKAAQKKGLSISSYIRSTFKEKLDKEISNDA